MRLELSDRLLEWDVRWFQPGTRAFNLAQHAFALLMPASYVSHMIMAVAQKPERTGD